jgi:predicted RNA-binding protein with PIN domain
MARARSDGDDFAGFADQATLDALRPAIELAFLVAVFGSRQKLPVPDGLVPFVKSQKMAPTALGAVCHAVEHDEAFRQRIAVAADEAAVGRAGVLWLRRPEGWSAELARVVAGDVPAPTVSPDKALLRRVEVAERDVRAVRAELAAVKADLAARGRAETESDAAVRKLERLRSDAEAESARLHKKLDNATVEMIRMRERFDEQREVLGATRADLVAARREVASLLPRQELLAAMAEARAALDRADEAIARTTKPRATSPDAAPSRERLRLPRGLTVREADGVRHLLAVNGIVAFVDGYNVAKLGWPKDDLPTQRERLNDLLDELATRHGTDLRVVYDGTGSTPEPRVRGGRRRRVEVEFSPAGVIADDTIVERVRSIPTEQSVLVVTSDAALTRRCERLGATVVTSATLLSAR